MEREMSGVLTREGPRGVVDVRRKARGYLRELFGNDPQRLALRPYALRIKLD